jgi:ribonuclease-3
MSEMNPVETLKRQFEEIEEKLGYSFKNQELLLLSFIHRSFVNEYKTLASQHNERLEFLGDSVLGLIVSAYLYHRLPTHPEGQLSQLRSKLVDAPSCANYLQKLDLSSYILLGRGEVSTGRTKVSILADVFEAIIGAIYLDGGMDLAKSFLICHFETDFETVIGSPPRNYKAELQDYSQKKFQKTPTYQVVQETGPDHAKIFSVVVIVNDKEAGSGMGPTKKEAEQQAAFDALSKRMNG